MLVKNRCAVKILFMLLSYVVIQQHIKADLSTSKSSLDVQSSTTTTPPPGNNVETKGPLVNQVSPTYRAPEKDPFSDPKLVRQPGAPAAPIAYPPLAERQGRWRERRSYAITHAQSLPDASEQYLVDEFDVKGIFSTEKGLGALLKYKGGNTMLFVRDGAKFWNGSVIKVDRGSYHGIDKGAIAGTVICSEVTLYSDKTTKTTQRSLTYIPKQ